MRNTLSLSLFFLILCLFTEGNCQQLEYDIIWLGKIGKLRIDKQDQESFSSIETISEVKVPFYKLNWVTKVTYLDGKIQSSDYSQLLNDKKREYMEIEQVNDSTWQTLNDEGKKELISIEPEFNVSQLYFTEPINEKYIFSERFGLPIELENKGKGHYRLLLPDKNYCDFFYEEGICKRVKAKNGSKTIKFVLADQT